MGNAVIKSTTDAEKQIKKGFLEVPLRPGTVGIYTVRTSILNSVKEETSFFEGIALDIGCGLMPYRKIVEVNPNVTKYIGMDLAAPAYHERAEPDMIWDGEKIPLENETVDCAMATEFLEHYPDTEKILTEIRRVIKPGGRFFATVPFIWNLHEIPYDEYRFTPYSIERHFKNAGFRDIEVKALGGWNASLAQMIGLWLTCSGKSRKARLILTGLLFPVYALLTYTDKKPKQFDNDANSMVSGLSITARK